MPELAAIRERLQLARHLLHHKNECDRLARELGVDTITPNDRERVYLRAYIYDVAALLAELEKGEGDGAES